MVQVFVVILICLLASLCFLRYSCENDTHTQKKKVYEALTSATSHPGSTQHLFHIKQNNDVIRWHYDDAVVLFRLIPKPYNVGIRDYIIFVCLFAFMCDTKCSFFFFGCHMENEKKTSH